jgi:hypothetical protein
MVLSQSEAMLLDNTNVLWSHQSDFVSLIINSTFRSCVVRLDDIVRVQSSCCWCLSRVIQIEENSEVEVFRGWKSRTTTKRWTWTHFQDLRASTAKSLATAMSSEWLEQFQVNNSTGESIPRFTQTILFPIPNTLAFASMHRVPTTNRNFERKSLLFIHSSIVYNFGIGLPLRKSFLIIKFPHSLSICKSWAAVAQKLLDANFLLSLCLQYRFPLVSPFIVSAFITSSQTKS